MHRECLLNTYAGRNSSDGKGLVDPPVLSLQYKALKDLDSLS